MYIEQREGEREREREQIHNKKESKVVVPVLN
jgi:hypothetical protein